jgi:hypothetical protein
VQLRTIQRAFREALLALPAEECDWFDIGARRLLSTPHHGEDVELQGASDECSEPSMEAGESENTGDRQRQFFEFPGPLFSVAISPASTIVRIGTPKELRALPRDRSRRRVENDLQFGWQLVDGLGTLADIHSQAVKYVAPDEPGLARLKVTVRQNDIVCVNEALEPISKLRIGADRL